MKQIWGILFLNLSPLVKGTGCMENLMLTFFTRLRFVASPIANVDKRLTNESRTLKTDITNLEKKLTYLETTHKNSLDHIEQIFKSGGKA